MQLKDSDPILEYRAASAVEAHALVAHLENEGIEARVLGEPLQGAYAGIRMGGMDLPEVWVASKDREAAEPVIAAWRAEHFPVGENVKPRRFQFSLTLALIVMTYIALLAGSEVMSEASRSIFLPLLTLLLMGGFVMIAWTRARARRIQPDEG
jgi:hypothetical protein